MKDDGYLKALKREADREREWRKTKQGAFESAFMSLDDFAAKFEDPGKIAAFSDCGAGEGRIFERHDECDKAHRIAAALLRLSPADRRFAAAVLRGATWQESGMPKSTFYRWVDKIEALLRSSISQSADI